MTLRAGIVGCGGVSRSHAAAYAHLDTVALVALCDINPAALDERANEHGVANRYTEYEELFRRERLDVVSVCTHAPLHTPVTLAAARAGVNVLCEKPLAIDLESADRMRARVYGGRRAAGGQPSVPLHAAVSASQAVESRPGAFARAALDPRGRQGPPGGL